MFHLKEFENYKEIINFNNEKVLINTNTHEVKGNESRPVVFNHAGNGIRLYAVPIEMVAELELERIHGTIQDIDDEIIEKINPYRLEGFLECYNYR